MPEAREVLVIAPHPDDEALGCAGTVFQLNRKGVSSTIAFLSNGERLQGEPSPEIGEQRKYEACIVSGMLGCKEPLFLNFPDGQISSHRDGVYRSLCDVIDKQKPGIVFSPSPFDHHADHIAASRVALELWDAFRCFTLAFYEVYSTIRFNCLIDISEAVGEKKKAISAYQASLYGNPGMYVAAILGLNAQRSIFVQRQGFYEAFYLLTGDEERNGLFDFLRYRDVWERDNP